MGRGLGVLARIAGLMLLLVVLAPVLGLIPAMLLDHGFDERTRVSAFPSALVVLDPLVWRCVRNSVLVALVVTVGSTGIGLGLGMILSRRRFWGRWPLRLLAVAPLVVSPVWIAPGVVAWVGGSSSWDWLAARSFLGQPGDEWVRWLALVWVEVAGATPLVILATELSLAKIDAAWADAARAVGAWRFQVWRDVTWPTIRPDLARVAGWIFTLTLVEPAGPIVLDIRRTLVVEMGDAALRFSEPNRAATLAVIAIGLCVAARAVVVRWGGPVFVNSARSTRPPTVPRAGKRFGGLAALILAAWAVGTWGPVVHFARRLGAATLGDRPLDGPTGWAVLRQWSASELTTWVLNSALTATLAVALGRCLMALLSRAGRTNAPAWPIRLLAGLPPMVLGVGALSLPSLLASGAHSVRQPVLVAILEAGRTELSPGRWPGALLILALAGATLPILAWGTARLRGDRSSAALDAALLAGASERSARQLAARTGGRGLGGLTWVAWTWASTDLATAWLLTTLPERRTLGPAALALADHGVSPLDPRLLALLMVTLGLRLIGLATLLGVIRSQIKGRSKPL